MDTPLSAGDHPLRTVLVKMSDGAFWDVMNAITPVTESDSLKPAMLATEGIFTDGTVLGILQHVIVAKVVYGNTAFGDGSLIGHWGDVETEVARKAPTFDVAKALFAQVHEEWLASWQTLSEGDLQSLRRVHSGREWPAWQVIQHAARHDSYHAGQIVVVGEVVKQRD